MFGAAFNYVLAYGVTGREVQPKRSEGPGAPSTEPAPSRGRGRACRRPRAVRVTLLPAVAELRDGAVLPDGNEDGVEAEALRPRSRVGDHSVERPARDDLAAVLADGDDDADVPRAPFALLGQSPSMRPTGSPAAHRAVSTPGRPSSATASIPESSPTAQAEKGACAAPQCALIRALSSYVAPSSGGGSTRRRARLQPGSARRSSSSLCGFPEARASVRPGVKRSERRGLARRLLGDAERSDPARGEVEQLAEQCPRERIALCGRLHLDEPAVAGHHDVHVRLGRRVLDVVEVEHGPPVDDADRDGGEVPVSAFVSPNRSRARCAAT